MLLLVGSRYFSPQGALSVDTVNNGVAQTHRRQTAADKKVHTPVAAEPANMQTALRNLEAAGQGKSGHAAAAALVCVRMQPMVAAEMHECRPPAS